MNSTVLPVGQEPTRQTQSLRVRVIVHRVESEPNPGRRTVPWLAVLVTLGLAVRIFNYVSDPPVWHDEAAQIYNVLHKGYDEIAFVRSFYSEACPPLFLALEKAVVALFGDGTFALRAFPLLASCASLVGLVWLARSVLPRPGVHWLAALIGFSDRLLWHASEAKPYAVDVLVATGLLALAWRRRNGYISARTVLLVCAALAPILVFLSFPACFLLGGVALTLVPEVIRLRQRSTWLAFGTFGLLLVASFLVLYLTAVQAQRNDRIILCWQDKFPPWKQPWLVPLMALVRTTELMRYAAEPAGNVLAGFAVVGAVTLWRSGHRRLLGFAVWPIGLNIVGWLASSYPLESSRVVVYAAPATLLLIAAGVVPLLGWLRQRTRLAPYVVAVLLVIPVGKTCLAQFQPHKRLDSATPTAWVLVRRQPDEPVVGTLWEQSYYCRHLGPMYRTLITQPTEPESLPSAALLEKGAATTMPVRSLWLLTSNDPTEQTAHVAQLRPARDWTVVERHTFRNVVVLRVRR